MVSKPCIPSDTMATSSNNPFSTNSSTPININHFVSLKLDRQNFLLWRAQFLPLLRGYELEGYVSGALPCPPKFLSSMDSTINNNYITWQKQDNILLGWILSSLIEPVLAQIASLSTSTSVWQALDHMFASKSRARIMQLKLELQNTKKGNLSMTDYL